MQAEPLTVSQLVRSVRDRLERGFPLLTVRGELSSLSRAPSGHVYFTLKDAGAQVDCVMFRSRAALFEQELAHGSQVEVRALATLYEPRGRFQLTVEAVRRAGQGALYERFLRLKQKLEAEGLFDPDAKREPPALPRRIGVVTSLGAAALRDVLTTLARRNRSIPVVVYPTPVQGEAAAPGIAAALAAAGARGECDVLLLVRGGGSMEDLWAFNDERVARAIRACPIPVVSGIGHETDFTIADFAADRRAATPTAAAEMASPPRQDLLARLAECVRCLSREMRRKLETEGQRLDGCARRLVHPAERLRASAQHLSHLAARLSNATSGRLGASAARLERLQATLAGLDPTAVLARGYSITYGPDGALLREARKAPPGARLRTLLADGSVESEVIAPASPAAASR